MTLSNVEEVRVVRFSNHVSVVNSLSQLSRKTLDNEKAISVEQGVLGRMFGFGSLTLTGTGGVHEVFHNISSPLEFRRRIHGQAA